VLLVELVVRRLFVEERAGPDVRLLDRLKVVLGALQVVRLVDEQHAALGPSRTSLVLGAVWPTYWPTRMSRGDVIQAP
jgi:hypothetical protein